MNSTMYSDPIAVSWLVKVKSNREAYVLDLVLIWLIMYLALFDSIIWKDLWLV